MVRERRERRAHGARAIAGLGLHLDHRAHAERVEQRQGVGEARHALAAVGRGEPRAGIERRQLGGGMAGSDAAPVGRALEPRIVQQERAPVARRLHVELHPVRAKLTRLAQPRERILRRPQGRAAMADDARRRKVGRWQGQSTHFGAAPISCALRLRAYGASLG